MNFQLTPSYPVQSLCVGVVFVILILFFGSRIYNILFKSEYGAIRKIVGALITMIICYICIVLFGGMIYRLF